MKQIVGMLAYLLAGLFISSANASVISENLGGTATSATGVFWGQSVTTGSGTAWNNLEMNFYLGSTPIAWGELYLLSSQYNGIPGGLSSSGSVLGVADASGGIWSFDPTTAILANTTYWFYTEYVLSGSLTGNNNVPGTGYYWTYSGTTAFASSPNDINYTLNGTSVPEPASLALLGLGLVGMGFSRKKIIS